MDFSPSATATLGVEVGRPDAKLFANGSVTVDTSGKILEKDVSVGRSRSEVRGESISISVSETASVSSVSGSKRCQAAEVQFGNGLGIGVSSDGSSTAVDVSYCTGNVTYSAGMTCEEISGTKRFSDRGTQVEEHYNGRRSSMSVSLGSGVEVGIAAGSVSGTINNFACSSEYEKTTIRTDHDECQWGLFDQTKQTKGTNKHHEVHVVGMKVLSTKGATKNIQQVETSNGLLWNESVTRSGPNLKETQVTVAPSPHLEAGVSTAATVLATKVVHGIANGNLDLGVAAASAAKGGAKQCASSVVDKVVGKVSGCQNTAAMAAAGVVAVSSNFQDLSSGCSSRRKKAAKQVVEAVATTGAATAIAKAATRACPKVPGIGGAAIEVAFAAPEVYNKISQGDYEAAAKAGGKAAVKGAITVAGAAAGPVGMVVAGIFNTLWWFEERQTLPQSRKKPKSEEWLLLCPVKTAWPHWRGA